MSNVRHRTRFPGFFKKSPLDKEGDVLHSLISAEYKMPNFSQLSTREFIHAGTEFYQFLRETKETATLQNLATLVNIVGNIHYLESTIPPKEINSQIKARARSCTFRKIGYKLGSMNLQDPMACSQTLEALKHYPHITEFKAHELEAAKQSLALDNLTVALTNAQKEKLLETSDFQNLLTKMHTAFLATDTQPIRFWFTLNDFTTNHKTYLTNCFIKAYYRKMDSEVELRDLGLTYQWQAMLEFPALRFFHEMAFEFFTHPVADENLKQYYLQTGIKLYGLGQYVAVALSQKLKYLPKGSLKAKRDDFIHSQAIAAKLRCSGKGKELDISYRPAYQNRFIFHSRNEAKTEPTAENLFSNLSHIYFPNFLPFTQEDFTKLVADYCLQFKDNSNVDKFYDEIVKLTQDEKNSDNKKSADLCLEFVARLQALNLDDLENTRTTLINLVKHPALRFDDNNVFEGFYFNFCNTQSSYYEDKEAILSGIQKIIMRYKYLAFMLFPDFKCFEPFAIDCQKSDDRWLNEFGAKILALHKTLAPRFESTPAFLGLECRMA